MSTRCKPGDLAYVSGGQVPEYLGRFVTCVSLIPPYTVEGSRGEPHWRTSPRLKCNCGCGGFVAWADAHLTPVRPGDPDKDVTTDTPTETSCMPQQVPTPERIDG